MRLLAKSSDGMRYISGHDCRGAALAVDYTCQVFVDIAISNRKHLTRPKVAAKEMEAVVTDGRGVD